MHRISIVIPVLNEAAQISPFLRHLRRRAPGAEIVVVDGGSDDGTDKLAAGLCDRLITTKRGRPTQMNAGAGIAKGDVLWFLHADNEIPAGSVAAITAALHDKQIVGGCFRVRILRREWIYRVHDGLAHYVGRFLGVRCGDHGIFVRRDVFSNLGGYPDVPLMEDVELFRGIQRNGRVAWLGERLLLSCRRHVQVGVYRYTFVCAVIVALYCLGLSPHWLARIYSSLVPGRSSSRYQKLQAVEDRLFAEHRVDSEPVSRPCLTIAERSSVPQ